ncbi:hypothetical protein GURKE_01980 [Brevundimonas phage vB_BpoS-Gurke]|uniref:Uncharacterized protein n=1 Tax=Brevundimonas phage vB_BpoS-Gurke TaxID=2948599 RepID=A0A9E7N4I6_9CAUD|nr:hypothetical protein GURKE_01980 [Brevundimonas phage vB_BpoS-Gurke]
MTQLVLPALEGGTNWGAPRRLIAVRHDKKVRLFIRSGLQLAVGARGFGREYHPTALTLEYVGLFGRSSKVLAEGRISTKTLAAHAAEIDSRFEVEIAAKLNPRESVLVAPDGGLTPLEAWPKSW